MAHGACPGVIGDVAALVVVVWCPRDLGPYEVCRRRPGASGGRKVLPRCSLVVYLLLVLSALELNVGAEVESISCAGKCGVGFRALMSDRANVFDQVAHVAAKLEE